MRPTFLVFAILLALAPRLASAAEDPFRFIHVSTDYSDLSHSEKLDRDTAQLTGSALVIEVATGRMYFCDSGFSRADKAVWVPEPTRCRADGSEEPIDPQHRYTFSVGTLEARRGIGQPYFRIDQDAATLAFCLRVTTDFVCAPETPIRP